MTDVPIMRSEEESVGGTGRRTGQILKQECNLECYYEAGVGVVVLKDRQPKSSNRQEGKGRSGEEDKGDVSNNRKEHNGDVEPTSEEGRCDISDGV